MFSLALPDSLPRSEGRTLKHLQVSRVFVSEVTRQSLNTTSSDIVCVIDGHVNIALRGQSTKSQKNVTVVHRVSNAFVRLMAINT
jgi:hypothetical protein